LSKRLWCEIAWTLLTASYLECIKVSLPWPLFTIVTWCLICVDRWLYL